MEEKKFLNSRTDNDYENNYIKEKKKEIKVLLAKVEILKNRTG